jgi:sugar (Glycoside-Pentoside-Hexuronide) transporter
LEGLSGSAVPEITANPMQKIRIREKLAYGCGDAANNVVWASVSAFLLFFFTDVAGISPVKAGIILLVARVFDGFVDVIVGLLVDKTNTRFGKARPWLLWMALPFAVLTVMLYTVPNFGATGKFVYAAFVYTLINIVYSCINIPYTTLNSLMTQDQYQRSVLNIFRMCMASGATLIVSSCTTGFVSGFGGGAAAWQKVFIIYAVIAIALFSTTFLMTKERVKPADIKNEERKVPIALAIKTLFRNPYLWLIVGISTIAIMSTALNTGVTIYYAQYLLGDTNLTSVLMMSLYMPIIIGFLFVAPLIKKFGKRNCALTGSVIVVISSAVLIFFPTNLPVVIACVIIKALGFVPLTAASSPMIFDTIEYGEWKNNVRTEGLICSLGSVASKIGTGLGAGLTAWILSMGHYVPEKMNQSGSALFSIKMCYIYLPAVLGIVSIIGLGFYKLDKLYPKIMQDLHGRHQEASKSIPDGPLESGV